MKSNAHQFKITICRQGFLCAVIQQILISYEAEANNLIVYMGQKRI
jgi:hypothetical protein